MEEATINLIQQAAGDKLERRFGAFMPNDIAILVEQEREEHTLVEELFREDMLAVITTEERALLPTKPSQDLASMRLALFWRS